ncbi:MAG: type II toxin-antitoxin system Phd/YefM family antitoxin [Clostridia bacterium]|nr:type II toxin-antitoxin system Phd/YefM family antitoxin [Clostridia bacterium]
MAAIRPISELRNNFNDVATLCNEQGEVFITRNGFGAYVLMTMEAYEEQEARLSLYRKLEEAEAQLQSGATPLTHEEVFGRLKAKYGPKR